MTILDKVIAAVTPPESDEERAEARAKARAIAGSGWLALILDHHQEIEEAFAAVRDANTAAARRSAQKELALILTGHSNAEESVIYPALALSGGKAHASLAYTEQSAAKVQMAALDDLDPMSEEYLDKLEHIRGAVAHHVYEEEGTWFPELREKGDAAMQTKLTKRYREEFARYIGAETAMEEE